MYQNQTRRGQTQTVVNKKSHSRGMLSGIFDACRCKNKDEILNPFNWTPYYNLTGRGQAVKAAVQDDPNIITTKMPPGREI